MMYQPEPCLGWKSPLRCGTIYNSDIEQTMTQGVVTHQNGQIDHMRSQISPETKTKLLVHGKHHAKQHERPGKV